MTVHDGPDHISDKITQGGRWEPQVCDQILKVFREAPKQLKGTQFFLDIGANIGYHSLCVAAQNKRTVSVEAAPFNFYALNSSREENEGWVDRMTVYQIAVSDGSSKEPLCFRSDPENYGGNSAVDPANHPSAGWHDSASHPCTNVAQTTIDTLLASLKANAVSSGSSLCPLVMKMDIEGFEHSALVGASGLLQKSPPCVILMEFHVILLTMAGAAPPMDTVRLVLNHGYQLRQPSMGEVEQAVQGQIFDLMFAHDSYNDANGRCWKSCL